ncbi:hypothetical protein B0H14DRAFT_3501167 [Mycena olivaceomarginata]|nr:hypothetical protein B0H14DRAFT_3501167 [Mycena olivaceomarginata]
MSNLLSTVYANEHGNEEDEEDQLSYTPKGCQTRTPQPRQPLVDTYGNEALSDGAWSDGSSPLSTIATTEGDAHEEEAEEQVGGGYPRREATPPPQNTPTYLRSKVQATEKASPSAHRAKLRRRAADPTNSVPPVPVPTNPASSVNPEPPASAVKFKPAAALKRPAQHLHVDVPDAKRVALPEGKSATASFNITSPVQFRGDLEEFLDVNQFQSVPIPPPPHGFQPPDDPMPALVEDDDEDNDGAADGATTDGAADDGAAPPARGRFSAAQQQALDACFVEMSQSAAACSAAAGLSVSRIVNAYMRQLTDVTARKDNGWNIYQAFANSTAEQRLIERRRVEPDYAPPPEESTPHLTVDELRGAWAVFKRKYSRDEMDELLGTFAELSKNETEGEQSLRQRQSKFSSHEAKLEVLLNKLSDRDSIEAFLILVGLMIITTPALRTFVQDISSCDDDLIAAAKLTAYTNTMRDVKVADVPNSSVTTAAIEAIAPPEAPGPEAPVDAPVDTKPSKAKQKGGKSVPVKSGPSHQDNIKSMRQCIAQCCVADTGLDLFNLRNNNFLCNNTAGTLKDHHLIMTGYPCGARLPELYPAGKATGAWRVPELHVLNAAMDARGTEPNAGLQFQQR